MLPGKGEGAGFDPSRQEAHLNLAGREDRMEEILAKI